MSRTSLVIIAWCLGVLSGGGNMIQNWAGAAGFIVLLLIIGIADEILKPKE